MNTKLGNYPDNPIAFLEDHYILPETKKQIQLEWWQKDLILKPLFYDLNDDGGWKYDVALIGMPKKNGKSTLGAGIGIYSLYCGEEQGEVIVAANDRDQASQIVYSKISRSIGLNPRLDNGVWNFKGQIKIRSTGTICRCIAHQHESAAGLNPSLTIFDELWGFSDRLFYDELTPVPTRRNPLVLIVTYAGHKAEGLLWELYQDGMQGDDLFPDLKDLKEMEIYVRRGKNDQRMFMFWTHQNLASWVSTEYLAKQKRRLPPNVFQRLHENRWAALEAGFITRQDVANCMKNGWKLQLSPRPEYKYIIAIDLGLRHDRTAMAVVHFDPNDQSVYLDQLKVWEGSVDDPVPIYQVERELVEAAEKFGQYMGVTIVIDPWQMEATIQKLRGFYNVKPFNFSSDMTRLSETLVTLIRNERFVMYSDPRLTDELESIWAKQTSRGWRIDHASGQRNDCVIALGMAMTEAVRVGTVTPGIFSL